MIFTFPSVIPSGINFVPTISGSQNIGNSNTPFQNIYANNFINTGTPSMVIFPGVSSFNANGTLFLNTPSVNIGSAITHTSGTSMQGTFCTLNINGIYSVSMSTDQVNSAGQLYIDANAITTATPYNGVSGCLALTQNIYGSSISVGQNPSWTGYLPSGTIIYGCATASGPASVVTMFTISLVNSF